MTPSLELVTMKWRVTARQVMLGAWPWGGSIMSNSSRARPSGICSRVEGA